MLSVLMQNGLSKLKKLENLLQLPERLTDQWVNKSLTQKAFTIRHDELDLLGKGRCSILVIPWGML